MAAEKFEPQVTLRNVALGKPAKQSSVYGRGNASRAVDGNENSSWVGRSITHTGKDKNAWWQVDLGKGYQIDKIVITNRKDCCSDRLSNFKWRRISN